jgi:hypothetical protein
VLKPGGRLALAAWRGPEENPWSSIPQQELRRAGLAEAPDPDAPGQFAWARQEVIAETLQAAGFVDFELDSVDFAMTYDDADDWWDTQLDLSRSFAQAIDAAPPERLAGVRAAMAEAAEKFRAPDGTLAMPARTWVAGAVA